MRIEMKLTRVLAAAALVLLSGCVTEASKPAEQVQQVQLPEPFLGVNIFVAMDLMAIPAGGIAAQKYPNPRKPIPFDDQAESEGQQMVFTFASDLRETIEPMFKQRNVIAIGYFAGAHYRWDELRKDKRNYSLIIWPTRASASTQDIDVRAVLVHEGTGREVWAFSFKDPYRSKAVVLGGYTRAERLNIVRAMSAQILDDLQKRGVIASPAA